MFDVIIEYCSGEKRVTGTYTLFVEAEQHRIDTEQYIQTQLNTHVERVYILEKMRNCNGD